MTMVVDRSAAAPSLSGRGHPGAAVIRHGAPALAASGAAALGGIAWAGCAGVAAATVLAIWLAGRWQARSAPGPALVFRQFCGVVSAQLGLAVATSESSAEQTLRATGTLRAALDPGGPPDAAVTQAVQDIWGALQHHDLLRQNLQAVQVALTALAEAAPDRLFDPGARVFDQVLADLRAAYVMEAQRAADGADPARPDPAAAPAVEFF